MTFYPKKRNRVNGRIMQDTRFFTIFACAKTGCRKPPAHGRIEAEKRLRTNTQKPHFGIMERIEMEEKVIRMLKTVFDPEIPVNIYDLGLIYKIDINDNFDTDIDMTLTAPNCPAADFIVEDVRQKVESIENIGNVNVNLVFEPEWDKEMMSEEAKLELGFM